MIKTILPSALWADCTRSSFLSCAEHWQNCNLAESARATVLYLVHVVQLNSLENHIGYLIYRENTFFGVLPVFATDYDHIRECGEPSDAASEFLTDSVVDRRTDQNLRQKWKKLCFSVRKRMQISCIYNFKLS